MRQHPWKRLASVAILVITALITYLTSPLLASAQVDATWDGASGDWTDDQYWSCNCIPDGNYNVFINSGVVTVNISPSVNALSLSAEGSLIVGGGNTLTSSAYIVADGNLTVNSDSALNVGYLLQGFYAGGGLMTVYGQLNTIGYADLGVTAGAHTTTIVNGTWTNSGFLAIGSGSLNITNGGVVADNGAIGNGEVGAFAGTGTATAIVSGSGSRWNNSGYVSVGLANNGTMTISDGGAVTSSSGSIGFYQGVQGTVTVTGANSTWNNNNGPMTIGTYGTGSLTISNGGAVTSTAQLLLGDSTTSSNNTLMIMSANGQQTTLDTGQYVNIGAFIGSTNNTATVTGAGAQWINSGFMAIGNGTLNVTDGGVVSDIGANGGGIVGGFAGTGMATATISGADSQWTNTAALTVGLANNGTMTISGGGVVTSSGGSIGFNQGIQGTVTVQDAGSEWMNNGGMTIGANGSGSLTINNGGTVMNGAQLLMGDSATSSNNTLMITSTDGQQTTLTTNQFVNIGTIAGSSNNNATVTGAGSVWTNNGFMALGTGGSGSLTISNGGVVTNTGALVLGDANTSSNNRLMITSGGQLTSNQYVNLGAVAGSTNNNATVTGAGSVWTNHGFMAVGTGGSGLLTISDGGMVSNDAQFYLGDAGTSSNNTLMVTSAHGQQTTLTTNQFVNIGAFVGSINNNATVTGPGSVWTNNGFLAIGAGTLNITNGGVVIDNGANGSGVVGDFVGSTQPAVATVAGAGSQWNNSTFVSVGLANNGTMTISGAGTVSSTGGSIGVNQNVQGTVTVQDAGSQWMNAGMLVVGQDGTGTLNIMGGGTVTDTSAVIGQNADSTGMVTVSGGSTWNNNGPLQIGVFGVGILTLEGGTVSGTDVSTGVNGALVGSGTLNASSSFTNFGAAIAVSGTLTVATCSGCPFTSPGGINVASGGVLSVPNGSVLSTGQVDIARGGTLTIGPGSSFAQSGGQVTVDGSLNVSPGASINLNSGSVFGNRGILGGPVTSDASFNLGDQVNTVGEMLIQGDFTLLPRSKLNFDIAGTRSGQFDVLNVNGHVTFAGLFDVDLLHGFLPHVGQTFDIMNYFSESGKFSNYIGLQIDSTEYFAVEYNPTNLTLKVKTGTLPTATGGGGFSDESFDSASNEIAYSMEQTGLRLEQNTPSTTPEPGTLFLLGSGLLAAAGYFSWKKKNSGR